MEGYVIRIVFVFVVGIRRGIRMRFIRLSRLLIGEILVSFTMFLLLFLCASVLVRNLSVEKNIANALVLDLNALSNVNAMDAKMVNVIIIRISIKCILWEFRSTLENDINT